MFVKKVIVLRPRAMDGVSQSTLRDKPHKTLTAVFFRSFFPGSSILFHAALSLSLENIASLTTQKPPAQTTTTSALGQTNPQNTHTRTSQKYAAKHKRAQ